MVFDNMSEELAEIIKSIGVTPLNSVEFVAENVWLINDSYILKRTKTFKHAIKVQHVTRFLKKEGVQVCCCVKFSASSGEYLLMERLIGSHIYVHDVPNERIIILGKELGNEIAVLHQTLSKLSPNDILHNADLTLEFEDGLSLIQQSGLRISSDIISLCEDFTTKYKELKRQPVHRDIQFCNLLFSNYEFVGFLDFDSCEINVRSYDLVYFILRVLTNEIELLDKSFDKLLSFLNAFLRGYQETYALSQTEFKILYNELLVIQVCFVAYYLQINAKENVIQQQLYLLNWIHQNKNRFTEEIFTV